MNKNILILSAGRRVELLEIFKQSLIDKRDIKVFTADSNPKLSPACRINNHTFKLPKCSEKRYIKELLSRSLKNNIRVIIPTIDDELSILAANKEKFQKYKIEIIISDLKFIEKSNDKIQTKFIFDDLNIKYPKIYNVNNLKFPCINKPIKGSSSKDIKVLKSFSDLTINILKNKKNYFSKYINKYSEFSADLYFSKDSCLKAISVRERLEIRNGEVVKSITNKLLTNKLYKYFKKIEGAKGPINIQFFYNKKKKDIYGIEINPRLGGGCTLSIRAGLNYPNLILNEYLFNKSVNDLKKINKNILMLRYDKDITI